VHENEDKGKLKEGSAVLYAFGDVIRMCYQYGLVLKLDLDDQD